MTNNVERVALVTGGSRGIGRAIAERLAESGCQIVVNYSANQEAADEVVSGIEAAGGSALAVRADVSDRDDVDALFEAATSAFGSVEILVNNAGITRDNLLLRMTDEDFDRVIATNLRSTFLCTKAALRGMVRARWGRVISIASVAGITGNPGQANYAASKAGIIGFSKSVAKEVGSRGITSNVIAPGFISTDMTDGLGDEVKSAAAASISLGHFGTPGDIAAAVDFLASEGGGYITGQVLAVDGGITL